MWIHRTSKPLRATLFLILLCSPLRSFCGEIVR